MSKKKKKRNKQPTSNKNQSKKVRRVILDIFSIKDITRFKKATDDLLKYQWEFYTELAHQRSEVLTQIQNSLTQNSKPFQFDGWQRLVRYQYSLDPLSA